MSGAVRSGLILAGVLAALGVAFHFRQAARAAPPRLHLEQARRELGPVSVGDMVTVRFPIRNSGGSPVRILTVEGDCGCTSAKFPPSLAPGAGGEVLVRFEPQMGWSGRIEKSLKVRTSVPGSNDLTLTIAADIIPFVTQEPAGPITVRYTPGDVVRREVRLTARQDLTIKFGKAKADSPLIRIDELPAPAAGGVPTRRLRLTIGPLRQPGDFHADVQVPTTSSRFPVITIPVEGLAEAGPVISSHDLILFLGRRPPTGTEQTRFQVSTRSGRLRVLAVEPGVPGLRAEIQERTPGSFYEVVLRTTESWKHVPAVGTLRVRLEDPTLPVLAIPIRVRR